jgi:hypothetical protein
VVEKTAVRMSAAFPYVPPEARPDNLAAENGVHLGNGGYFDNSGVFALSEWLKEAVEGQTNKKRILLLELDAFPDSANRDTETSKQWYYQVSSPLETMLNVRSEAQVARDKISGEDLQTIFNENGFQTTWLLVRAHCQLASPIARVHCVSVLGPRLPVRSFQVRRSLVPPSRSAYAYRPPDSHFPHGPSISRVPVSLRQREACTSSLKAPGFRFSKCSERF